MGSVLEHFVLPINIRIDVWITAILELLQFRICISWCKTIVQTGFVQGIGITIGIHHVSHLRVELELMRSTHLKVVFSVFTAMLGLHQQYAVDTLMSVECYGGSIFQNSDTLHLLNCQAIERTLHTVDKDQDIPLASSLDATYVKCRAAAFLSFETCVLKSIQAQKLTVQGICQTDG